MTQGQAETVAIQALAWLAGNDELLPVFMGATGSSAEDIRNQLENSAFLISALDFLMNDDSWVISFCDAHNFPYETLMQARQSLPGGAQVHWT